ncbi:MAG: hypothetical protein IT379_16515 [Deltaproteobacteria bacterium]|nr:hypothetical protein [Deltaproteobacteria bacterium]
MKLPRTFLGLAAVTAVLALSCGSAEIGSPVSTTTWNGGEQTPPTPATPAVNVTASIASVTLGDNCAAGEAADAPSTLVAGRCAAGSDCGTGPACRPTTLQLALTAGAGSAPASVEVASVELYDARSGSRILALTPAPGQVWTPQGTYGAWDGRVAASQSLQVSYRLRGLDWSRVTEQTGFGPHDGRFRVRVVVRVNGESRELASEELGREPMIVT